MCRHTLKSVDATELRYMAGAFRQGKPVKASTHESASPANPGRLSPLMAAHFDSKSFLVDVPRAVSSV